MDWGLFDENTKDGENKFLRDEVVYSSKVSYFMAMILLHCFQFSRQFNFDDFIEFMALCSKKTKFVKVVKKGSKVLILGKMI